ncbi:MAG: N-acetyltransferase [Chitinophagaceae bacterium]
MEISVTKTNLDAIAALRVLFLQENNFQFVYNKCHQYGWADEWVFTIGGEQIGYGAVWGKDKREDRDTIFEFYLLPAYRKFAGIIFQQFYKSANTAYVECQTNDALLSSMLYQFCKDINAEAILFKEHFTSSLQMPDVVFKKNVDDKTGAEDGYALEHEGEIVATGGFVWNYNLPFIDMYYDVVEQHRRKGLGSFITQELKKEAYRMQRVPAARCNINNHASKATLLKAGMQVCGHIVIGQIK